MPDISIEKLILFVFAVLPGFVAMQVYGLKCPTLKRDWGNSLIEVVTYSLINLTLWLWWVIPIVQTPFKEMKAWEVTAAILCVCFVSPILLALAWYWLRTSVLHSRFRMDHPTPKGWDYFVRTHHEYWILFHWKNGKCSGGYFGSNSYAATFPQEPEIYVEELWRVDDHGEFVEMVEDTLGGVIRISECERVEFFNVKREMDTDEPSKEGNEGVRGAAVGGPAGKEQGGTNGQSGTSEERAESSKGRLLDGAPEESRKVT